MSNDFFSDPEFYGISGNARLAWIFILCIASKKMCTEVKVNVEMLADTLRLSTNDALAALDALLQTGSLQMVGDCVISARSNSIVVDKLPSATNERTDERTNERASTFNPSSWLDAKKILPHVETQENPKNVASSFFEPDDKQELEEVEAEELPIKVLTALNTICFRNFRPVKANLQFINARIKEGYTYEDFVAAITHRKKLWGDSPKMQEYLRPKTLFNGENFDGYVQAAKTADKPILDPLDAFFEPYLNQNQESAS
jgi:uncharacterized phage protein (TIGR02220 family)